MHKIITHLKPVFTRQYLILLGTFVVAIGILTTTYVALHSQDIRNRAEPSYGICGEGTENYEFAGCDQNECGYEVYVDDLNAPGDFCSWISGNPDCSSPSFNASCSQQANCNNNGVCELGEPLDSNVCSDCPTAQETACSQTRNNSAQCWFDSDCSGSTCNQSSCVCQSTGAQTFSIEGYKVLMPGNFSTGPQSGLQVNCVSGGGSSCGANASNPYLFPNLAKTGTYSISASSPPSGMTYLGYTLCYDSTNCHNNNPTQNTVATIDSAQVQPGGVANLWFHYSSSGGGGENPSVVNFNPTSPMLTGKQGALSATGTGTMSYYIHGIGPRTPNDSVLQTYDPSNINPNSFYKITDPTSFVAPTTAGVYYLVVNATSGSQVCAWNNTTCNIGEKQLVVEFPVVNITGVTVQGPSLQSTINISANASQVFVYIHNGPPVAGQQVLDTYSTVRATGLATDKFYRIGNFQGSTGQVPFQVPTNAGTYYIVVDAHSRAGTQLNTPDWTTSDRVCAWDRNIYRNSSTGGGLTVTQVQGVTCANNSPYNFTVSGSGVTPGPTSPPVATPTTGGGIPTSTPVPTATRVPTAVPTAIPTVCPGCPTNTPVPTSTSPTVTGIPPGSTGLVLSLNLEGFSGTSIPPRDTEPVEVFLKSGSEVLGSFKGQVKYSINTRHFDGTINLGTITTKEYEVFVKPASYLQKSYGVFTIQGGSASNSIAFASEKLVLACDINNDHVVNGLDINQIYSDIKISAARGSVVSFADITRDGKVDIFDHNYCVQNFLKEGDNF